MKNAGKRYSYITDQSLCLQTAAGALILNAEV